MFSINEALVEWRNHFELTGRFDSQELDELQDHLLMLWEQKCGEGEPPDKAFNSALAQMGEPELLASEFSKRTVFDQARGLVADDAILVRALGLVIALGGLCHTFYGARFLWRLGNDVNTGFTLLFLFILWTVWKGVQMMRGNAGSSIGILLFFMMQVPVLYFSDFRYDVFSGLALTVNLGDAPSLFGYGLGGKLYVDIGETRAWDFIGINLYALAVCVVMGMRMLTKARKTARIKAVE